MKDRGGTLRRFAIPRTVSPETLMEMKDNNKTALSYEEKNHQLFLRQKAMLDGFLERGAISQAQHDKSLHDLAEKMGEKA
jgi:hypothetical protein